ncbi:hypothetical protein CANCADRAFT_29261 [Tortispora caseinolytica NRRL Y-17796]|uniref:Anaphase-promoting complex subunit 11 n=1 Tax=Tortispora caseinolytica NRRL Y-17796 TaxID=767744 RepID=A0A1E4TAL9_9ASCO|nr:hypothetical protein CANCADRAFT_29261 [Tortispora caseinolytica NRRL Y-17796]
MKVHIENWQGVAAWHWDVPDEEVCGICRANFDNTCPGCKYPGDGCPLLVGTCSHSFHEHCLVKWVMLETSRGLCPMCRQPFVEGERTRVLRQGRDLDLLDSDE